jgi:hypothetical protein
VNSAPDSVDAGWSDKVAGFFTFGPGYTAGTYILVILGILLFIVALIAWVYTEDQKLSLQAEKLRRLGLQTESRPAVAQVGHPAEFTPGSPHQTEKD